MTGQAKGTGRVKGAVRTYFMGRWYHSKAEAKYASELETRRSAGDIIAWKPQVTVQLIVNGRKVCAMIVDFRVTYPDGRTELVEVKGHETDVYKLKRKLLAATYLVDHPEVTYRVVGVPSWGKR